MINCFFFVLLCYERCAPLWYKNKLVFHNLNIFSSIIFFFMKYIVFLQSPNYGVITLNISVSIKK